MKAQRLCTLAIVMALPLAGMATAPGAALARSRHHRHGTHRAHHPARKISFLAQVVHADAHGLLLRTKNGRLLSFSTSQIRAARPAHSRAHAPHAASDFSFSSGNVVINVLGLQPGTIVDVTETIGTDGSITITITLPPAATTAQASGVVTDVEGDSFTLVGADGTPLLLHMDPDQLSLMGLQLCQTVDVTYHADDSVLIADSVTPTGTSTDGDCAPTTDTDGVIMQVSDDSLTIDTGQGTMTYSVDPSAGLTDGYQPGDLVDVTSTTNPDGSLQAVGICFVEKQASGVVTAITTSASGGSLTLEDADSGDSLTVYADPSSGVEIDAHAFNGISVGDQVSVTYHQSAGQQIADTVSDS